jgi:hypothetical protein
MHYSNFIKSGNKLALDPTVVISGGATTTTVYESEAAADINELREQNDAMKYMLDDTTEFDAIDEAIKNSDIMSTGVLDNISDLESGFKTAVKDVKTDDSKYPDMDPDNIQLPESDNEDVDEGPSATFTISDSSNKWDVVTSTDNTSLTASAIDTNSLVSKIINGGNGRVVSSVPIEAAPENNHNPFENNEHDTNETTEAKSVEKPVEEAPVKEHPLVALFKNPEDIYRITTVLEHAKALAEAENPTNDRVNINQEQMEFVMGLLMDIGEKYFPDIPLADTPDFWFIANIPVDMYNAILNWYNQDDLPDVLNPVVTLYVAMCEEPELAYGRFIKLLNENIYDNILLINKLSAEYVELIKSDDEEVDEDDAIETDYEEEEDDE